MYCSRSEVNREYMNNKDQEPGSPDLSPVYFLGPISTCEVRTNSDYSKCLDSSILAYFQPVL